MNTPQKRHPFMDDLADDVVLGTSVLRKSVTGREAVIKVVKAGASQYVTQAPRFLGTIGERSYSEYDVTLADGSEAKGLVSILRDADARVTELNIAFSPLGAILLLATGVRDRLEGDLKADFFL